MTLVFLPGFFASDIFTYDIFTAGIFTYILVNNNMKWVEQWVISW